MSLISLIIILIILAMDSFDITLSKGESIIKNSLKENLTICLLFALAQVITLTLGYVIGALIQSIFSVIAESLGLIVLMIIGIKMTYDGVHEKNLNLSEKFNIEEWGSLALIASLDSLAIGITFKTMEFGILEPLILIGIITFILSGLGILLGEKFSEILGNKFESVGGIILILLAINMLRGII